MDTSVLSQDRERRGSSVSLYEKVDEMKSDEEVVTDNPLVAIFDKYGGTYFVPARRLYETVRAVNRLNKSRAIILVEKK